METKETVISKEQCRISAYSYVYMMIWQGPHELSANSRLSASVDNVEKKAATDINKIIPWPSKKVTATHNALST